jgi:Fe2+ or Zn2+ uptake regulation protein
MLALSPEEKKERGAKLSEIKTKLMETYEAKEQSFKMEEINLQLQKDSVDISLDSSVEE